MTTEPIQYEKEISKPTAFMTLKIDNKAMYFDGFIQILKRLLFHLNDKKWSINKIIHLSLHEILRNQSQNRINHR